SPPRLAEKRTLASKKTNSEAPGPAEGIQLLRGDLGVFGELPDALLRVELHGQHHRRLQDNPARFHPDHQGVPRLQAQGPAYLRGEGDLAPFGEGGKRLHVFSISEDRKYRRPLTIAPRGPRRLCRVLMNQFPTISIAP